MSRPAPIPRRTLAVLLGGAALAAPRVGATTSPPIWQPERPMRWIVAYAAGGSTDALARMIGAALGQRLGQPVVVENRPGAATNIGAEAAAKAPPDGHTLFTADNGTLVFNPLLFRRLPYDPERDFRPIGLFARFDLVLAVPAGSPFRDAQAWMAAARTTPGGIDYGSPGVGSPQHLAMERLAAEAGLRLNHVVYRGGAPALADMIAGRLASQMMTWATGAEAARAGQVRVLATASARRMAALPEVPTLAELGLAGYEASAWQSLVVPAATPDAAAARLTAELLAITAEGSPVAARIREAGAEPLSEGPEAVRARLAAEREAWGRVIRERGISLEG